MRYQLLGPVEARGERGPAPLAGPKQRLVLALLALDTGQVVSVDRFVDVVWDDEAPDGARHVIQTYVSELRHALDDEIARRGAGYSLLAEPDAVDVHRFAALVDAGRARLPDAPAGAATILREALALWHGEPLADLPAVHGLEPEIHRLRELRLAAVEDRIEAELELGLHASLAVELEALTREHPYRERLRSQHMLALYRTGRQADALRAYHDGRRVLRDELGIDPAPELQLLYRRILEHDPELAPASGPVDRGELTSSDASAFPGSLPVVRGFELREAVGGGSQGGLYRAYQASLGREVAIRLIPPDGAGRPEFVRRFELRARQIARLDHPAILPLIDYWRDSAGAYLVSPWVAAGNLRRALRERAWSLPATQRLIERAGSALVVAHRAGVVHGRLSASTILLDAEGDALVADFAVEASVDAAVDHADADGLAPEVRLGEPPRPPSDVYGLAMVAIEALTAAEPPAEEPASRLAGLRPDLPEAVVEVLTLATARDPKVRPQRVDDLLRLLRQAAGTDVIAPPVVGELDRGAVRNPYKGLRAFDETDAADFFGRERLVGGLVAAIEERRLVAVVGPSGSGKSSLVRAGLLPALRVSGRTRSGAWLTASMFPGTQPFEELATSIRPVAVARTDGLLDDVLAGERGMVRAISAVLPDDGSELLLFVDQFEELFSLTTDREVRSLFLDALVATASEPGSRVRIVLTLRADYLDRPLEHPALGALIRDGLILVTSPSREELVDPIVKPAELAGLRFEPGLVERIIRDVGDQPGSLPLLQHALAELYERREGAKLTAAGYEASGGVRGALARRAEELFTSLDEDGRRVARQLFLRLVAVDDNGEDGRRRVRRGELSMLASPPGVLDEVTGRFGRHRLLSFDRDPITRGPTIEVAHEALFRDWPRLRGWIDERREDLLLQRRLAAATAEWRESGEADEYLLGGARLANLERWALGTDLALTAGERQFLERGRAREDVLERGRWRRRLAVVATAVAVAVATSALAAAAVMERGRAEAGERVALARALAAESHNQLMVDHDLAVLLALEAVETTRSAGEPIVREAREALHTAVGTHRLLRTADMGSFSLAFAEGTRMVSAGPPRDQPVVWDRRTGEVLVRLTPGAGESLTNRVNRDGRFGAAVHAGGSTVVWDLRSGETVAELDGIVAYLNGLAVGPGGERIAAIVPAASEGPAELLVRDVASGEDIVRTVLPGAPSHIMFSPDGRRVAVTDLDAAVVRLFDATSGRLLATLGDAADPRSVAHAAFDPQGRRLAMFVTSPSEVRIVDATSNETLQVLGIGADGGRLCFAAEGRFLVAAAADELIHVYDSESGEAYITLPGSAQINGLSCSAGEPLVGSTTSDGTARIWDLRAEATAEVVSIGGDVALAGWTDAGSAVVAVHEDGSLRRHDLAPGTSERAGGDLEPAAFAIASDGRMVAVPAGRGAVAIHDARSLERITTLEGAGVPIAFSRDGARLLVGGETSAQLLEVSSGRLAGEVAPPPEPGGGPIPIRLGAWLADDGYVVAGGPTPTLWLLDSATGERAATICLDAPARTVAATADGRRLAVGDPSSVAIYDVDRLLAQDRRGEDCPGSPAADPAVIVRFTANAWLGLAFDPPGSAIATSGFDGTLGVWDARTGERILRLERVGLVVGASFSPDGRHVLAVVRDARRGLATLEVFTLDDEELTSIARAKATRELTPQECRAYLPIDRCPPS